MITMMPIQKIDVDLKKPGLVLSSTGGMPVSASSFPLGSAGADALVDGGFLGAIFDDERHVPEVPVKRHRIPAVKRHRGEPGHTRVWPLAILPPHLPCTPSRGYLGSRRSRGRNYRTPRRSRHELQAHQLTMGMSPF